MAIYLSSLPVVSTTAKDAGSDQNLTALGALTCAYLIVEEDGEEETQELFARARRNQINVTLRYQGTVEGQALSFELERPTFAYALIDQPDPNLAQGSAIYTLPALVHYSSLPPKLREHVAALEQNRTNETKKSYEAEIDLLGKSSIVLDAQWWQRPVTLPFEVVFKHDHDRPPLSLGQLECVIATSEDNEANYFNYLEPTLFFFDYLLANHQKSEFTDDKLVSYDQLYTLLEQYCSGDLARKHALILSIAQKAPPILRRLEPKLRKSLLNTRKLLPVERVNELDGKCLEYLLRLEGNTLRDKAQKNKMRIMGLTKEETYNLLENRVLKDFLERCIVKAKQYLKEEEDFANQHQLLTNREQDQKLKLFKQRCADLSQKPPLATVNRQTTLPKPNFVLQKDHDYKQIWGMYLDLLREKRALDQSLICQQNLYQDVCELLVNIALCHLSSGAHMSLAEFTLKALRSSNLSISLEQMNGHRIKAGSAAGPFLIQGHNGTNFSLEVVTLGSSLTSWVHHKWHQLQISSFEQLLATAPCYLVLTKVKTATMLNQATEQVLIPIFTFHSLTQLHAMAPVQQALYDLLGRMVRSARTIVPYLLFSTLEPAQQNTHFTKLGHPDTMSAYLSPVSIKPQQWMGALAHIEHTLTAIFNEVLHGTR